MNRDPRYEISCGDPSEKSLFCCRSKIITYWDSEKRKKLDLIRKCKLKYIFIRFKLSSYTSAWLDKNYRDSWKDKKGAIFRAAEAHCSRCYENIVLILQRGLSARTEQAVHCKYLEADPRHQFINALHCKSADIILFLNVALKFLHLNIKYSWMVQNSFAFWAILYCKTWTPHREKGFGLKDCLYIDTNPPALWGDFSGVYLSFQPRSP